jgi:hypothetical protein
VVKPCQCCMAYQCPLIGNRTAAYQAVADVCERPETPFYMKGGLRTFAAPAK